MIGSNLTPGIITADFVIRLLNSHRVSFKYDVIVGPHGKVLLTSLSEQLFIINVFDIKQLLLYITTILFISQYGDNYKVYIWYNKTINVIMLFITTSFKSRYLEILFYESRMVNPCCAMLHNVMSQKP